MKTKTLFGASFAVLFVFAMMTNPVFAAGDPKEITNATADGDTVTITTAGKAGINVPDPDKIFGYVVITDNGAFIVATHLGIDDDDATSDHEWHSHSFELTDGCVSAIDGAGVASISGNTITITGTGASSVTDAFFVTLKINPDDSICVHKVHKPISFS